MSEQRQGPDVPTPDPMPMRLTDYVSAQAPFFEEETTTPKVRPERDWHDAAVIVGCVLLIVADLILVVLAFTVPLWWHP